MQDGPERAKQRIGILTGSGPEAGIDLWTKVLAQQRRLLGSSYRGDIDAPDVTVVSVPELGHSMDLPQSAELVWQHLEPAARRLAAQVDVYAIACNTLYFFERQLVALALPARLVSPVDCVHRESQRRQGQRMALVGARPVTDFGGDTSPYAGLAGSIELELHAEPGRVHRLIEQIKIEGGAAPALEAEFAAIVSGLESSVALLACTELPLVAHAVTNKDLIDVTDLLAEALVRDLVEGGAQAG